MQQNCDLIRMQADARSWPAFPPTTARLLAKHDSTAVCFGRVKFCEDKCPNDFAV